MGVLSTFRDSVTLVNRTSRVLSCRYDGEDINLKPGENPGFPLVAVPYAKKQNPLRGSGHPINPMKYITLVGVKDTKDDITPISDETMRTADRQLEVVDRDGTLYGEPMRKVQLLRKKPFDAFEAQVELPGDYDVNRNID